MPPQGGPVQEVRLQHPVSEVGRDVAREPQHLRGPEHAQRTLESGPGVEHLVQGQRHTRLRNERARAARQDLHQITDEKRKKIFWKKIFQKSVSLVFDLLQNEYLSVILT